jgi:hypothetical protein
MRGIAGAQDNAKRLQFARRIEPPKRAALGLTLSAHFFKQLALLGIQHSYYGSLRFFANLVSQSTHSAGTASFTGLQGGPHFLAGLPEYFS